MHFVEWLHHSGKCTDILSKFGFCSVGCWLGDPSSNLSENRKVWVQKADATKVQTAEIISRTPVKLALNLMTTLFSEEELARGNCTPTKGRELLNPRVILGIRRKCNVIVFIFHDHLHA